MILYELFRSEDNEAYQLLQAHNAVRQYSFLETQFEVSNLIALSELTHETIKALNFHAIANLHRFAGRYRPSPVHITNTPHHPPRAEHVRPLMEEFLATLNAAFDQADAFQLAAYALWRINWIHPFVNGNGRTARMCCYYILCKKFNQWLPGRQTLPSLIKAERDEYCRILRLLDDKYMRGLLEFTEMAEFLQELLNRQLDSTD